MAAASICICSALWDCKKGSSESAGPPPFETAAACDAAALSNPANAPSGGTCYKGAVYTPPPSSSTTSSSTGTSGAGSTSSGGSKGSEGADGSGGSGASSVVVGGGAGGAGGGGSLSCTSILLPGACNDCIALNCCVNLHACAETPHCIEYFSGISPDPAWYQRIAVQTAVDPLAECAKIACTNACAPHPCNPVTQAGCDLTGPNGPETCDTANLPTLTPSLSPELEAPPGMNFICWPPPNNVPICQQCDPRGLFCDPGLTCLADGGCARYCCDDSDCGTGVCNIAIAQSLSSYNDPSVGVCVVKGTPD